MIGPLAYFIKISYPDFASYNIPVWNMSQGPNKDEWKWTREQVAVVVLLH